MLLEGRAGVLWTPMILKMVTELTQALALQFTFSNSNKVLIKSCCYGNNNCTAWPPSSIIKYYILGKIDAKYFEVSRKHGFFWPLINKDSRKK